MEAVSDRVDEADVAHLLARLSDPRWRICSLYTIVTDEGKKLPFRPNAEQLDFLDNIWFRNSILKARQLGFTTELCIFGLDQCLFNNHFTAIIIAHKVEDAGKIFRNKVKFVYDNLPEEIRARCPLAKETQTELVFQNGSSISVSTSARSGTCQLLHVSEFGKICARYPERAREIITGAFEAVPKDGIIVLESTAEGQGGPYYDITIDALGRDQAGIKPNAQQFRLHFYPWWKKAANTLDEPVALSSELVRYFGEVLAARGIRLTDPQKWWYAAKAAVLGDDMKREHPSFPEEAFEQRIKGAIYGTQMAALRQAGRITSVPYEVGIPVNTFWDLGVNDINAIWYHQRVGIEDRFIRYYQAANEGLAHYVTELQRTGYIFGTHYLPHDADARMQNEHAETRRQILQRLMPGQRFVTVARIDDITTGLDMVRAKLPTVWIDKTHCVDGIRALDGYQYEWNEELVTFRSQPLHNWASNGADAIRQWAQGFMPVQGASGFQRHRESWRA